MHRIPGESDPTDTTSRGKIIDSSSVGFDDLDHAFYELESQSGLDAAMDRASRPGSIADRNGVG